MTQPPDLDDATRARIRAEEVERLKVREELAAETRVRERPSYWAGVALNLLVVGAGLMYIGRLGLGLMWLIIALVLGFTLHPLLGWLVGVIGGYIHYDMVYGQLYATAEERAADARQGRLTWWLLGGITALLTLYILIGRATG